MKNTCFLKQTRQKHYQDDPKQKKKMDGKTEEKCFEFVV